VKGQRWWVYFYPSPTVPLWAATDGELALLADITNIAATPATPSQPSAQGLTPPSSLVIRARLGLNGCPEWTGLVGQA